MRRSKSRRFTNDFWSEVERHKVGFRDSGIACADCGSSVPLKYRGEEANPESFHLGRCDGCYVKTAEGFTLYYRYNPAIENAASAAFYLFWPAILAKLFLGYSWWIAGLVYAAAIIPGTVVANRASRWSVTPQRQAEDRLKDVNAEDEKIRKWIMLDRAEKAALEKIRQKKASGIEDIDKMTGVQFENRLQSLFASMGYLVQGTPASGDQGLDLILKRDGKTIGVQAKRYAQDQTVGNAAVQEVIAGKIYYDCDEGWVVTNCKFTESARALAKKADIRLIDRDQLIKLLAYQADERTAQ